MVQPVAATVYAVVREFSQALACDAAGYQYALVLSTRRVPWDMLQPGDSVRLWLTPPPVRVERA